MAKISSSICMSVSDSTWFYLVLILNFICKISIFVASFLILTMELTLTLAKLTFVCFLLTTETLSYGNKSTYDYKKWTPITKSECNSSSPWTNIFQTLPKVAKVVKVKIPQGKQRQQKQNVAFSNCFTRTCDQVIIGRQLSYARALQIIQNEEYLEAAALDLIKRKGDRHRAKRQAYVPEIFSTATTDLGQICVQFNTAMENQQLGQELNAGCLLLYQDQGCIVNGNPTFPCGPFVVSTTG